MSTHSVAPVVTVPPVETFTTSFIKQIKDMEGKLTSWEQDFGSDKDLPGSLLKDEISQIYDLVQTYLGKFSETVKAYKNFQGKVYSPEDLNKQISKWKVQPAPPLMDKLQKIVTLYKDLEFGDTTYNEDPDFNNKEISELKDRVAACVKDELNELDSDSD